MHRKLVMLVALVAVAGFAAAAGALTVKQRQDTSSVYAERYTVGEIFVVEGSALSPIANSASAAGVPGAPVEMTAGLATARTALTQDNWAYVVTVKEATATAVGVGQYVIELQLDGAPVASLHVEQAVVDSAQAEGVRATFDLGASVGTSALYYVVVKPFVPTGPTVDFVVRSTPAGDLTWQGVGGSIDGAINPTLDLALGSTLRLTARNADNGFHNIGLRDAGGNLLSPPGWSANIDATGEEAVLTWAPAAAGTYTYGCQYHPDMKGTLAVA